MRRIRIPNMTHFSNKEDPPLKKVPAKVTNSEVEIEIERHRIVMIATKSLLRARIRRMPKMITIRPMCFSTNQMKPVEPLTAPNLFTVNCSI